jgi:hypothetical protein
MSEENVEAFRRAVEGATAEMSKRSLPSSTRMWSGTQRSRGSAATRSGGDTRAFGSFFRRFGTFSIPGSSSPRFGALTTESWRSAASAAWQGQRSPG